MIEFMNIKLPITFANDNDYLDEFIKYSKKYVDVLDSLKKLKHLSNYTKNIDRAILTTKSLRKRIVISFNKYLKGDVSSSIKVINKIIKLYGNIFVSEIGKAYAFIGNYSLTNKYLQQSFQINELTLVKGRIGEPYQSFAWQELFHIPLNKREIVSSQRYSIPGILCLYLAQNSYVVWKELKCPSFDKLSLSIFKTLNVSLKIIDLTFPIENIIECLETNDYDFVLYGLKKEQKPTVNIPSLISQLIDILPAWILILAVSFTYSGKNNRSFKSEYVVPQLIMYSLAKNDCIGVTYHSNQIDNRSMFATNLAIPLTNFKKGDVLDSSVKSLFEITTPLNMGYYNEVLHENYRKTIDNSNNLHLHIYSSFNRLIYGWEQATYDKVIHYGNTKFYYIDEFMIMSAESKIPAVRNISFN